MNNKINQQQINNNINNSEFEQFKPIFERLYEQNHNQEQTRKTKPNSFFTLLYPS